MEPDSPPHIEIARFPAEEHEAIRIIERNLRILSNHAKEFRHSLTLFDFSATNDERIMASWRANKGKVDFPWKDHSLFSSWMFIAARNGAMEIYHFGKTRDGINESFRECPTLRSLVSQKMKIANELLETHFSNYAHLRHTSAHASETANTTANLERHAIDKPITVPGVLINKSASGRVIIGGSLNGRTYSGTWKKQMFSYEISEATAQNMEAVRDAYYEAFRDAEKQHPAHS